MKKIQVRYNLYLLNTIDKDSLIFVLFCLGRPIATSKEFDIQKIIEREHSFNDTV